MRDQKFVVAALDENGRLVDRFEYETLSAALDAVDRVEGPGGVALITPDGRVWDEYYADMFRHLLMWVRGYDA